MEELLLSCDLPSYVFSDIKRGASPLTLAALARFLANCLPSPKWTALDFNKEIKLGS